MKFKFYTNCPGCGRGAPYLHTHKNCTSYEEIDEDGMVYCNGCNSCLGFIADLTYKCQYHEYKKGDFHNIINSLYLMKRRLDIPNKVFIKIIEKLEEYE